MSVFHASKQMRLSYIVVWVIFSCLDSNLICSSCFLAAQNLLKHHFCVSVMVRISSSNSLLEKKEFELFAPVYDWRTWKKSPLTPCEECLMRSTPYMVPSCSILAALGHVTQDFQFHPTKVDQIHKSQHAIEIYYNIKSTLHLTSTSPCLCHSLCWSLRSNFQHPPFPSI